MNTKFTKGEWCISFVGDATYIDSHTGLTIARVFDMEGSPHDAHLIAAAPDMYALLLKFLPMDEDGNGPFEYNEGSEHYGEEVEALIAKARGEL
tara:strand:+ start:763 stop:1044 length:282 start_codon:yes stop_codon:yes gene_type:complete